MRAGKIILTYIVKASSYKKTPRVTEMTKMTKMTNMTKITSFFSLNNNEKTSQDTSTTHTIRLSKNSYIVSGKIPSHVFPDFEEMLSLREELPDTVIMMGKPVLTPRFVSHYLKPYYYTGRVHEANPLPATLVPLLNWANGNLLTSDTVKTNEKDAGGGKANFNQVLVNYYMNGTHYIGKHSDDERQLVPGYPIFSASFGQTRTFRIRSKDDDSIVRDISMNDGTYILMCGDMQKEFKHEVPKVLGKKAEELSPRINVTFRVFK